MCDAYQIDRIMAASNINFNFLVFFVCTLEEDTLMSGRGQGQGQERGQGQGRGRDDPNQRPASLTGVNSLA